MYCRVDELGLLSLFSPVGEEFSGVYTCQVYVFDTVVDERNYNLTVQGKHFVSLLPAECRLLQTTISLSVVGLAQLYLINYLSVFYSKSDNNFTCTIILSPFQVNYIQMI